MKPCLSQATTMAASFAEDVANFADAGCQAMEVWLTKLEDHLKKSSLAETRELLAQRGMTLAAACYQGGLLLSQGDERKAHLAHFRQRLELCQALAIPTLVLAADFLPKPSGAALERAVQSLAEAAQWADAFGIHVALEFRARDSVCSSLDTALALVHQAGEANLGVCLDVFHFYHGPSKFEDLALLTPERLAHVQLCDVAGVPRELATDNDRILPGDGDFQLEPLLDHLKHIGYQGFVALEALNPTLWQANPKQVAEVGFTALRKALGLTEPPSASRQSPLPPISRQEQQRDHHAHCRTGDHEQQRGDAEQ